MERRNAADKGFDIRPLNGVTFSVDTDKPVLDVERGKRYRMRLRNASDDIHPVHLHRHTFEVTHIAGAATHGLRKDVVMLGGYQTLDFDFTADRPGLSLFHCHQQPGRDQQGAARQEEADHHAALPAPSDLPPPARVPPLPRDPWRSATPQLR
ncbi:multicopper oxidase domain-containing protein [Streptomyces sp. NPDC001795]|uniref:multicopper oxidase domain-containing protein n=1 Tax=Streptomyces sp. NPDC001795 TaxID=3154525 RepID=UPI00332A05B0